jgi:hypothetical protein
MRHPYFPKKLARNWRSKLDRWQQNLQNSWQQNLAKKPAREPL